MKKVYLLFAFLVVGLSAKAATDAATDYRNPFGYGDAFIFNEGGIEFAVFPNGEFDFHFSPQSIVPGYGRNTPFSFNGGYNYNPFVQYDDYGAVIQIERVPVYYDYYGRIVRAGRVQIGYNHYGVVNRIGNLFLQYDPYNQYTRYSGYINSHNRHYTFRPWHEFYRRPSVNYTVVYNQPYRRYYAPQRLNYGTYKKYYKKNIRTDFRRSYYTPGDRVTTYYRGSRSQDQRELKNPVTPAETRSNRNTNRVSKAPQSQAARRSTASRNTTENKIREKRSVRSRSQENATVSKQAAPVRESRSTRTTSRRTTTPAAPANNSESTNRSRSSRGRE
ncbi:MAG: hypothetical protein WBL21_09630 [Salinimicrobium sp.]